MKKRVLFILSTLFIVATIFAQTSAGPDYFGYRCKNSNDPDGPEFNWEFATANASSYNQLFDDDNTVFDIGFEFPFYGYSYEAVYVSSNGFISFGGAGMTSHIAQHFPNGANPNAIIAWWWHDLNPNINVYPATNIFYENLVINNKNAFVITFESFTQYGAGNEQPANSITAQIILFDDGEFTIQYNTIGQFGVSEDNPLSIGIEDEAGAGGISYFYTEDGEDDPENNQIAAQMAIHFTRPLQNDLMGWGIFGNNSPGVGVETNYDIKVQNVGFQTQANYIVQLLSENGDVLATADGIEVEHAHSETYTLTYTPTTVGEMTLFGHVILVDDEDVTNDTTSALNINVIGVGSINGFVTNDAGDSVEGATVQIAGSTITDISDAQGFYQFDIVPIGTHNVNCDKFGFTSDSATDIEVTEGNTTAVNFTINTLETITVNGYFIAQQDNDVSVENVEVNVVGYENYTTTSDENGFFEISGIYANKVYNLTGSLDFFYDYTLQLNVQTENIELGNCEINAIAPTSPSIVATLIEDNSQVEVTWTNPEPVGSFQYYKLYRFIDNNYTEMEEWDLLADNFTDTTFVDTEWYTLVPENYFYAVIGIYALELQSYPTITPQLVQNFTHNIIINTFSSTNLPIENVEVVLEDVTGNPLFVYSDSTSINGSCTFDNVFGGLYTISLSHPNYENQVIEDNLITTDHAFNFQLSLTSSNGDDDVPVFETALIGNYPNPFNPVTKINFSLAEKQDVSLAIYNVLGQKVDTLVNTKLESGNHSIIWDGTDSQNNKVGNGIYFYKLNTQNYTKTMKMVLLK